MGSNGDETPGIFAYYRIYHTKSNGIHGSVNIPVHSSHGSVMGYFVRGGFRIAGGFGKMIFCWVGTFNAQITGVVTRWCLVAIACSVWFPTKNMEGQKVLRDVRIYKITWDSWKTCNKNHITHHLPPRKSNIDTKNDVFLICISFQIWLFLGIHVSFSGV